jgi:WD40 repeat protein
MSVIRSPSRAIDRLFGYDVFIAHRRVDAARYAAALVERLDREGLSTFIDVREYGPGDELATSTLRHIRKATMLIVLGSPATLERREPDWVLSEIDAYMAANSGESLRVLPIDFGGTLAGATGGSEIARRLRDVIRLDQPLDALDRPPSDVVVEAIARQFRNRRRDRVRLRVFQGVAAVLSTLLVVSLVASWLANRALHDAQRNLAANYMTAARSRLEAGFRDEAAALAAESLRHVEGADARRLITENPPLDLSRTIAAGEVSMFAAALDLARGRWATAGYQGRLSVFGPGVGARADARLGKTDLFAIAFAPDGQRLLAGDDRGRLEVRSAADPRQAPCGELPRFDGRISRFEFLPDGASLLVNAGKALHVVDFNDGCPSGAPREIYRGAEEIIEFVLDAPRGRVVVADGTGLSVVALSGGAAAPPVRVLLPIPPGRSERPQPARIAVHPPSGKLCVLPLGGDELIFLDEQFVATAPLAQRPFGAERATLPPAVFQFDARGDRLVISGPRSLVVWSVASGRAERRLSAAGQFAGMHGDVVVWLDEKNVGGAQAGQAFRMFALDAPARLPVSLMGSDAASGPKVRALEASPRGASVLAAVADGRVLRFDFATGALADAARADGSAEWAARSPDGERVAVFGAGADVAVWQAGKLVRKASFIAQSATGLYSAAWLDDGGALAVGGGWTAPLLLPVDPSRPVLVGPMTVRPEIKHLIAGPGGSILVHAEKTWIWNTAANRMDPVDLVGSESLALTDLAAWGRDGVGALTRSKLFLSRWREGGRLERTAEVGISGDRMAMAANGRRVALFARDRLALHDLPSGTLRAVLPFAGDVYTAALSEDGSMLLGGSRPEPLVLWSLRSLDGPAAEVADAVQRATGRVNPDFTLALPGS